MTTETTAAANRRILANAHAAWIATSRNPKVDAIHNLKQALVQTGFVESTDWVKDVRIEGTTIVIVIDFDEGVNLLELDAYGNTLRGKE